MPLQARLQMLVQVLCMCVEGNLFSRAGGKGSISDPSLLGITRAKYVCGQAGKAHGLQCNALPAAHSPPNHYPWHAFNAFCPAPPFSCAGPSQQQQTTRQGLPGLATDQKKHRARCLTLFAHDTDFSKRACVYHNEGAHDRKQCWSAAYLTKDRKCSTQFRPSGCVAIPLHLCCHTDVSRQQRHQPHNISSHSTASPATQHNDGC